MPRTRHSCAPPGVLISSWSPARTNLCGLARTPFTVTFPPAHASAARARERKARAAQSQRSIRTAAGGSFMLISKECDDIAAAVEWWAIPPPPGRSGRRALHLLLVVVQGGRRLRHPHGTNPRRPQGEQRELRCHRQCSEAETRGRDAARPCEAEWNRCRIRVPEHGTPSFHVTPLGGLG